MRDRNPIRRKAGYAFLLVLAAINVALYTSVIVDRQVLAARALEVVPRGEDERQVVRALTLHVRNHLHHCSLAEVQRMPLLRRWNYLYNPFHIGPRTALEHGGDHTGACGSSSRVLMEMLRAHGINTRFLILLDDNLESRHTLLEVFYERAWGAVDPLYGILYEHPDGRPASMKALRCDAALFLRNAKRGWEYGYGPSRREHRHSYNTEKYPFRNAYYFNYGKFGAVSRCLHGLLRAVFGGDATLWIHRRTFYAYPALTTVVVIDSIVICLTLVHIALRTSRRWFSQRGIAVAARAKSVLRR